MTIPSVTNSAVDASTSPGTSHDITLTVSSNSGRVLVAFPAFSDNAQTDTISSVTFDPGGSDEASFTNEAGATATHDHGSARHRSEAWYLVLSDGVSNGSYTIRIVASSTVSRVGASVWEVADADTTDPIGATGTGTGTSATPNVDVTTGTANSLVGGGSVHDQNANHTPDSGTNEVTDHAQNLCSLFSGEKDAATTGTYNVGSTNGGASDFWAMSGVEILEASAAEPSINVSDDATATDTVIADVSDPSANVSDDAEASESVDVDLQIDASATDNATATDSVTVVLVSNVTAQDDATATDTTTLDIPVEVTAQDDATATDTTTLDIPVEVSAQDDATATDSVTVTISDVGTLDVNVSDDATATDTVTVVLPIGLSVQDDATATDTITMLLESHVSVQDDATATDSASASVETPDVDLSVNISPSANYVQVVTP